jgi:uncharacterized protein
MDKVVHFEIPADDQERAKKFYQDTFGWQLQDMPGMEYAIATTIEMDENQQPKEAGAINGGIGKRSERLNTPSFAIHVKDIDEALTKIKASGGSAVTEKMPVGEMGSMAYFKDSEGNVLSLWQAAM